ncbi:MAG: caspase family protein, partial [Pedobacter sp.]
MKLKLTFGLLILFFAVGTVNAQKKHALIFAIGDYPESGGWSKISSAQDVGYIKNTLTKQGFAANEVKVVSDSAATKEGIKAAFENLIGSVGKKDIVVIHISSHGEQVADDNNDEADGYDETIVSYNAALSMGADKTAVARGSLSKAEYEKLQANYFRDDEFGVYIQRLRNALGSEGDVVVFMDNCHSGTGTRGSAKTRG